MAIGTAALVALAAASGNFSVPVVAGDGTKAGASADGSTRVLAEPAARGHTRFAVMDTQRGRLSRIISLRGDYAFDAMSPDGGRLFLVHYLSRNHRRYAIQTMKMDDTRARLRTVVEKGKPGERMSGAPITRVNGNGGWIYTLYDGNGAEPFIHALQSADAFTVCIDLDALEGRTDLASLRLTADANELKVLDGTRTPILSVNPGSFEVTELAAPHPKREESPANASDTDRPWPAILAGIALATAFATLARWGLSPISKRLRSLRERAT